MTGRVTRSDLSQALAKAIAYRDCGKPAEAAAWAAKLAEFMAPCGVCDGEGGVYAYDSPHDKWGDPTPAGEWIECPMCHGSGWASADDPPPEIDPDERFST